MGSSTLSKRRNQFKEYLSIGTTEVFIHPSIANIYSRYTDFLVNEIDPNGNVVHLTTLNSSALDESSGNSFTVDFEKAEKDLVALMEGQDSSYIPKVIDMAKNGKKDEEALFIPLKDTTKEWRTSFHQYIRENLPTLRSETKTKEGGNSDMKVWFGGKDSDNKRRGWPSDRPKHLKFVLYKENKDTTDAIQILSKLLKVKPNLFTFAGTKDKRGVTCQYVTVPKIEASRMAALNKRLLGLKVGNFEYVPQELRLGDHKGNEFTIIIRDIGDPEAVKRSCDIISENGFINYFGMQRFGTGSIPTHHIGKLCMQENWKQVVEDILRPRKGEPTVARNARSYYNKTQDIRGTLKKLPKFLHVERYVLEGLEKHGKTNYLSAFQSIPKQMRLMYIHAYQSYVWNEVVSKRIELFGYQKLVKGDLVAIGELREGDPESNIKVIKSDEEGSNFSIEDLVLPLPGTKIMYPENVMRDHYIEVMARDNLSPTELDKHKYVCFLKFFQKKNRDFLYLIMIHIFYTLYI